MNLSQFGILKIIINENLRQLLNYWNTQEEQIKTLIIDSKYEFDFEDEVHMGYQMDKEMQWLLVTFRNSFLLSTYAFFESILVKICRLLEEKESLGLSLKDISGGSTIDKVKKYIKHVAQINFPDNSKHWSFLRQCNILRNSIVHSNGEVDERIEKMLPLSNLTCSIAEVKNEAFGFEFIKDQVDIFFMDDRFYLLRNFCRDVLFEVSYFFNEFFNCNPGLLDNDLDRKFSSFEITLELPEN